MDLRAAVISALFALTAAAGPAWADGDHDRARAALQAGEIRPLAEVMAAVERDVKGDIIEVELEREHGLWIYEVKVLTAAGAVLQLEYDARNATLLRQRARNGEMEWRR